MYQCISDQIHIHTFLGKLYIIKIIQPVVVHSKAINLAHYWYMIKERCYMKRRRGRRNRYPVPLPLYMITSYGQTSSHRLLFSHGIQTSMVCPVSLGKTLHQKKRREQGVSFFTVRHDTLFWVSSRRILSLLAEPGSCEVLGMVEMYCLFRLPCFFCSPV